jgi:hypothetical protein
VTGCCTCSDCELADEPFCVAADTELGCAAACFLQGICFENPARFDNGVLTLTLPKRQAVLAKRITVS